VSAGGEPDPLSIELVEVADALAHGRELYVAGDLAAAAAEFADAIAVDPRSAEAHRGLAKAVRRTDPQRGRAALERAVLLQPASFQSWRALAAVLRALGDGPGAEAAAARARETAPSDAARAALALDLGC
jgi:Tfp pilus assembly protein PilF